jgi:uncharacterized protein (DUF2126 family)
MKMKRFKYLLFLSTVLLLTFSLFVVAEAEDTDFEIVMVVKLEGVAWFDNMRLGVEEFAKETGVNAYQIGAATADPASQIALIEDLIAKKVDAIIVVPNDPVALERLELVFKTSEDFARALIIIKGSELYHDQKANSVSLAVERGVIDIQEILNRMEKAGIQVETLTLRKPTLDDVFMHFTGRKAEEGED